MHDVLILPGDIEGDSCLAEEICESLIHSNFSCSCHCLLDADLAPMLPRLLESHIISVSQVVLIEPAFLCLGQLAGEKEDLVLDLWWARWAALDIP
jgi:hypothetical protein